MPKKGKSSDDFNKPYLRLVSVSNANGFKATLELDVKTAKGSVSRTTKTVKINEDLFDLSGERELYQGYILENIDCYPGNEAVEFTNGVRLALGQTIGNFNDDDLKRAQINATIKSHLDKELRLLPKGIKVLSLFFIDRVENYRQYDADGQAVKGKYALMFEEEYQKLIRRAEYRSLFAEHQYMLNDDAAKVHDGYFSVDNKGRAKNTSGETQADYDTYSLIMKDKEKLLSFETPLRFIFSHSALKEGWDNPNVFQICTLVETRDPFTKRQKIGRGLRLAVNQEGERVYDPNVNILTVMANESFEEFAATLQREIEEETGVRFGVLEKHSFAAVSYTTPEGNQELLGYDNSEKVWNYLVREELIQYNGKVKEELKQQIAANTFVVPEEFKPAESQIIQTIKKAISKLPIKPADKQVTVALNKQVYLSPEFDRLWEKIKYKTTYSVQIDIEKLIDRCIREIRNMPEIGRIKMLQEISRVDIGKAGVGGEKLTQRTIDQVEIKNPLPDLLRYLQDETKLTRKTLVAILIGSERLPDFEHNPQKFMEIVAEILKRNLRHMVMDGIKYEKVEGLEYYKQEIFEADELKGYLNMNAIHTDKNIYSYLVSDSQIERSFAERMERDPDVKVYAKLPPKFKVETPIGNYNPDWAVLIDNQGAQKLYFVVETKGNLDKDQLRFYEDVKIRCAVKHFKALNTGIRYEMASDFDDFKVRVS